MQVETAQRSRHRDDASAEHDVAVVVESGGRRADDLDWQAFSAASFPGRRRHDLEALTAYCTYRRSHEVGARSSEEPGPIEARPDQGGSTALRDWEDEGGAAR